jgi:uncharacterized protein
MTVMANHSIAEAKSHLSELIDRALKAADAFLRRLDLPLRTPDALNVAIARRIRAELATFDTGMAKSARALGCQVVAV